MYESAIDGTLRGKRVLIVEDSAPVRTMLREMFLNWGAEAQVAQSGREAMVMLPTHLYDVVVMDLVLGDCDGWQVLQFMQRVCPRQLVHTVLITGDRYRRDTLSQIDAAGLPVVYTPFDLADLRSRCRTAASVA